MAEWLNSDGDGTVAVGVFSSFFFFFWRSWCGFWWLVHLGGDGDRQRSCPSSMLLWVSVRLGVRLATSAFPDSRTGSTTMSPLVCLPPLSASPLWRPGLDMIGIPPYLSCLSAVYLACLPVNPQIRTHQYTCCRHRRRVRVHHLHVPYEYLATRRHPLGSLVAWLPSSHAAQLPSPLPVPGGRSCGPRKYTNREWPVEKREQGVQKRIASS